MASASELDPVLTKQQRIAELAKQSPHMGFTSLAHHIDLRWLHEAYLRTRPDGAPGVDGQTIRDYNRNLPGNLRSLLERAKSGTYHAPPVRRVHIPKGTGSETRPIGIPTFEDKVLQRAVVMVLEAIYEQDFRPCSYGFRPGRSVHQALDSLWRQTMGTRGGWVVEVDIRKFFDTLDHAHLRDLLRQRIRDGVLLRLIGKWLNAGVLEASSMTPACSSQSDNRRKETRPCTTPNSSCPVVHAGCPWTVRPSPKSPPGTKMRETYACLRGGQVACRIVLRIERLPRRTWVSSVSSIAAVSTVCKNAPVTRHADESDGRNYSRSKASAALRSRAWAGRPRRSPCRRPLCDCF
jgi:hypothetical protein